MPIAITTLAPPFCAAMGLRAAANWLTKPRASEDDLPLTSPASTTKRHRQRGPTCHEIAQRILEPT